MVDFDEKLCVSELLSIYGSILTSHQAEMMRLYYDCDISLFEISEQFGISRQAVRDALQRGVKTLKEIDSKLNVKDKFNNITKSVDHILDAVNNDQKDEAVALLEKLKTALED